VATFEKKMKTLATALLTTLLLITGCSPASTPATAPSMAPSTPLAPTAPVSPTEPPCSQTAKTQLELNQCSAKRAQGTHAKLKQLIEDLRLHTDEVQYARLLELEEMWESVIAEHCEWQASFFDGGSVQPLWYAECLNQQYSARIEALRLNLCEGHGMTGECEESLKYKE
jgi:uncharacterized protein YecT (DUF1311 family)